METRVVSDAHGPVKPETYDAFEGINLILHAGDDGGMIMEPAAPVIKAVAGNVDVGLYPRFKEVMSFEAEKRAVHLQHTLNNVPEEKRPLQNMEKTHPLS